MTLLKDANGTAGETYSALDGRLDAALFPDTVLYVDSAHGNNNNTGRSPGVGGALATVAAAVTALPAAGGTVNLAAGTHTISSAISTSKPLQLKGAGRGKTVLLNTVSSGYMLSVVGTKSASAATTVNIAAGATTVTMASGDVTTLGLAAGDRILVRSSKAWSTAEAVPKNGEIVRIKSIVGGVLTLYDTIDEAYLTADTTVVEKLNTVNGVRIEGVTFTQTTLATTTTQAVRLLYCLDPIVSDCEFRSLDSAAVQPETCPGFKVIDCHFQDLTDDVGNSRVGYGVNIGGAARDGRVRGCTFHNVRHAVTTNGTSEGVPRHCLIDQCIVSGQSTAAGFDTHTSARYITFTDCEAHGFSAGIAGFNVRGLDVTLINPQVRGGSAIGIWISDVGAYTDMRCKVLGGTIKDLTANRGVRIEGSGVLLDGLSIDNTTAAEAVYVQTNQTNMVFRNLHVRSAAGALATCFSLDSTSTGLSTFMFQNITCEDTTWAIRFSDGGTYSGAGFVDGIQLRACALVFPVASSVLVSRRGQQTIATDAIFTLTPGSSPVNTKHTGTLTANRAVTLSTTGAQRGNTFVVSRTGAGAFTLDIGTGPLCSLAQNKWGEFVFDGAAWYLARSGSITVTP